MKKTILRVCLLTMLIFSLPCAEVRAENGWGSGMAAVEFSPKIVRGADTAYQKLEKGKKVRVAVLGDSIGIGAGAYEGYAWFSLLASWLGERYGSRITLDNFSVGGSGTFTGFYQCETKMREKIEETAPYDLVIICYGQNDIPDNFYQIYEGLLRSVKKYNPNCQIITILESCQKTYTGKMHIIVRLSFLYGADVADTIKAFSNSGLPYEELSFDEVHPNSAGHKLYFETIAAIIDTNVKLGKPGMPMPEPSDPYAGLFDGCRVVPLEECVYQDGAYRFITDSPVVGVLYERSPESKLLFSVKLNTGYEAWNAGSVIGEWEEAALIKMMVSAGTEISLEDKRGDIKDMVVGFIVSGKPGLIPPMEFSDTQAVRAALYR